MKEIGMNIFGFLFFGVFLYGILVIDYLRIKFRNADSVGLEEKSLKQYRFQTMSVYIFFLLFTITLFIVDLHSRIVFHSGMIGKDLTPIVLLGHVILYFFGLFSLRPRVINLYVNQQKNRQLLTNLRYAVAQAEHFLYLDFEKSYDSLTIAKEYSVDTYYLNDVELERYIRTQNQIEDLEQRLTRRDENR